MKRNLIPFLILTLFFSCNPDKDKKVYYVYDPQQVLSRYETNDWIVNSISIPVFNSLGNIISYRVYYLFHFLTDDDGYSRDTSFRKPASFLKSINYYDSDWLLDEKNLNWFWPTSLTKYGGREDTAMIFLIRSIPGTDSIQLEQVHRFYKPNSEGGSRPDE